MEGKKEKIEAGLSFDTKNMANFIKELLVLETNTILRHETVEQRVMIHFTGTPKELQHLVYNWLVQRIASGGSDG